MTDLNPIRVVADEQLAGIGFIPDVTIKRRGRRSVLRRELCDIGLQFPIRRIPEPNLITDLVDVIGARTSGEVDSHYGAPPSTAVTPP